MHNVEQFASKSHRPLHEAPAPAQTRGSTGAHHQENGAVRVSAAQQREDPRSSQGRINTTMHDNVHAKPTWFYRNKVPNQVASTMSRRDSAVLKTARNSPQRQP